MKPLLDRDTQMCAADILVRLDQSNNAMDTDQAVDMVKELNPELDIKQASQNFNRRTAYMIFL